MKNYTTDINGVLNEWLDDSGTDVEVATVQLCDECAEFGYDPFYKVRVRWIRDYGQVWQTVVIFTQKELDAYKDMTINMDQFIRSKLEKESKCR